MKKLIKKLTWNDWQDTLIFWVCTPGAVLFIYFLASFGD